jgi:hypothetical protein
MRKLYAYSPPPEKILAGLGATLKDFPRISLEHLSWQTGTAKSTAPTVTIDGTLEGWNNSNYRGSLEYLDRFQQALQQRHYGVTARKMPLDVSSGGSITDNALDINDKPAGFTLQLTWGQAQ